MTVKPKANWFVLQELCTTDEAIDADTVHANVLGARLYDAEGRPALVVFQFPLDVAHDAQLAKVRAVLEAQFETPVLILDPSFRALKLREATEVEARRFNERYKADRQR